ncbi:MAG: methyltransferase domain-containing protein [Methanobacteriaceae archaeon]|jgi:ubiquinone/menaquinone biosynthesis C-methylase UbiE|nr:methyltransferase domain-containing protein [Methanobacteriaceae archaeon]MDP2835984.1 methyltransferase domain-containing protein [Methanobacteriaceae archaeon]MDP3035758.1 methyltransferase domain-containing protein [Methanobacteriaceae archaeon]MDP3484055.1 methyltransferase domain-containing protein [Methanobacteriaceae archaeon]MDP3622808.1 methyltransferase domain-containing protein [Methanobacteriaceae archaeon]
MKSNSGKKIWFLGRGYEEYLKMFDLDLKKLKSMRILDCAAGASSFTSRITKMGYEVTAADIMYDTKPEKIENVSEDDFKTLMEFHNGLEDKVDWDFFKKPEELTNYRIETYKEFAEDYKKGKDDRYVKAELPILPFPDNSFDLVLCSHLLLLYEDRLSVNSTGNP